MLQYFAKEFFAPTIVTSYLDVSRQLRIYAVSEVASLIGTTLDAVLLVQVYNWNSFKVVTATTMNATLVRMQSLFFF